jgi:inner membrane protein
MDNLTHSLTGLALARTGLRRLSPYGTLLFILSANAPDADIVVAARGGLAYFEAHRGYSHSFLALPLMALLCVAIVAGLFRRRLPWFRAFAICAIGVASHLLLDLTNSYGIRLLLPFSSRWFCLDLNNLYDGWILAALLIAAFGPLLSWLLNREIGDRAPVGRLSAFFALGFFLLFDAGRAILHNRAIAQLNARLYNGVPPIRAAALPAAFNPLRWTGVVETEASFEVLPVETLGELDESAASTYFKPPVTPALKAARTTEPFRYLEYFSRFPVWSEQPLTSGNRRFSRVELSDLRFGAPGEGSFHAVALIDSAQRVLGDWFTFGPGTNLGYLDDAGPGSPSASR